VTAVRDLTELRALLVHRPLQWISPLLHRQLRSLVVRRRRLDLRSPTAFNEKLNWRCLYDRRELLAFTCDKLAMKDWAAAHGGPQLRIPRTVWAGTDLAKLTGVDLPARWVLKPNHRSGLVHFGRGPVTPAELPDLRRTTTGWLREHLAAVEGEWAYSRARACFLVEEQMPGEVSPDDVKCFTFGGRTAMIVVDSSRYGGHRRTVYGPDWTRLDVEIDIPSGPAAPPPGDPADLLATAHRLGEAFDFIRVDLYRVGDDWWFGELTPYPGGGYGVIRPWSFDVELGRHWTLPELPDGPPARTGRGR
jgi:hypothetical protein